MGEGVWLRTPAGRWRDVSAGLPQRHAMPLAGGPDGALYGGTMGYGVYWWAGSGAWRRLGTGLTGPGDIILSLAHSGGAHPALLAGTVHGVFRLPLPG
jgi:hypothetical protein